jgi:hypothetical protein
VCTCSTFGDQSENDLTVPELFGHIYQQKISANHTFISEMFYLSANLTLADNNTVEQRVCTEANSSCENRFCYQTFKTTRHQALKSSTFECPPLN